MYNRGSLECDHPDNLAILHVLIRPPFAHPHLSYLDEDHLVNLTTFCISQKWSDYQGSTAIYCKKFITILFAWSRSIFCTGFKSKQLCPSSRQHNNVLFVSMIIYATNPFISFAEFAAENFIWYTVACEKLDPLFFLNYLLNIQRRTPKPSAMCWNLNPESLDLPPYRALYLQNNLEKTRVLIFRKEL